MGGDREIVDANGDCVAYTFGGEGTDRGNAQHIVKCVNMLAHWSV